MNTRLPMRGNDGLWLQDSATNLMVINAVYTLDPLDLPTLKKLWQERVMAAGGGHRFPRFTLRVVRERGRWFWEKDPDFDLDRHIVECTEPDLDSREKLQDFVSRLASEPLPEDRPRWQLMLVPAFRPDRSALIVRIHHVMGDGMALVPVLFALIDPVEESAGAGDGGRHIATGGKGKTNLWALALKAPLAAPFVLARRMFWRPDRHPLHGRPLRGGKRVAWSEPLPVERVKEVKNALGATVNDVLMACVAGAFRRHLEEVHGQEVWQLRASVPVNMRAPTEAPKMENKFATVLLELPVGVAGLRERVEAVKRRMDALKQSVEPLVMFGAAEVLLRALPWGASRWVADLLANKTTCVLTNVPGPEGPLYIAGRQVHNMMFWVPQRAAIGVGISLLSFSGSVRLGVIGDVELLPDPGHLVQAFEAEFAALRAEVGLG